MTFSILWLQIKAVLSILILFNGSVFSKIQNKVYYLNTDFFFLQLQILLLTFGTYSSHECHQVTFINCSVYLNFALWFLEMNGDFLSFFMSSWNPLHKYFSFFPLLYIFNFALRQLLVFSHFDKRGCAPHFGRKKALLEN